ncbi:signal transduction histidine kinase [Microbacterium resistens]|uniref:histidine kinase n=1 Tax=Microbacterium resistens TaxID=156977 RepID=A0ABU1S863_9MICO|nr:histidine kinase [Microbacterium resistens]MDR6865812.1 signal transduction histidine kinase [Microbacterium resistens]
MTDTPATAPDRAAAADRVAGRWQRHPRLVDVLTAVSWFVLTAVPVVGTQSTTGVDPGPIGYILFGLVAILVGVALALFRRRWPVLVFVVALIASLVLMPFWLDVGALAAAYAVFAIAVYDSVRRAWIAAGISYALTLIQCGVHLVTGFGLPPVSRDGSTVATVISYLVFDLLLLLVALFWGQNAGNRRRYVDALLERARVLEHERDQEAQLAALAERSRIARDVHDIVSHSLSVIVRLADGARVVLDGDPIRAREAVAQIGGVARSSLDEMRRAIGVLERPSGEAPPRSSTGLDDLPRLAEVYRGIGLPVELVLTGAGEREVPAGVQMTVFRVMQESLTNALRHAAAPTRVEVSVRVSADGVRAEIRDDGEPAAAPATGDRIGRGLVGMRERAALYGGTLDAGPVEDGGRGWIVRLVLPEGES